MHINISVYCQRTEPLNIFFYYFILDSPDGKRHRSMKELFDYLDKHQIEMETEHLLFSASQLMEEAGIPPPSGVKNTRKRTPGPKCSKKGKDESSDEGMEVADNNDVNGENKVNGNMDDGDDMNNFGSEEKITKDKDDKEPAEDKAIDEKDSIEEEKNESGTKSHVLQVDVHVY